MPLGKPNILMDIAFPVIYSLSHFDNQLKIFSQNLKTLLTNPIHCIKIRVNKINRRERGVSFQSINTESRRWWDCGIRQAAEWTFEGGPER